MATRPGRTFARLSARGPRKPGRAVGNAVALHEAIILCMVRAGDYRMSLKRLVRLNKKHDLYRRTSDNTFPDHVQIRARVRMWDYRHLFEIDDGVGEEAKVSLRMIGKAPALRL